MSHCTHCRPDPCSCEWPGLDVDESTIGPAEFLRLRKEFEAPPPAESLGIDLRDIYRIIQILSMLWGVDMTGRSITRDGETVRELLWGTDRS